MNHKKLIDDLIDKYSDETFNDFKYNLVIHDLRHFGLPDEDYEECVKILQYKLIN